MSSIGMPPHLLALFQARPPLDYIELPKKRKMPPYDGMAFAVNYFEKEEPPPVQPFETPKECMLRKKRETLLRHEAKNRALIAKYDPLDGSIPGEPFKTLFVARISYETTEKKLKREFEQYGPIRHVRLIYDRQSKPRGYGFIEFESDRDVKEAYKLADGRKIDGRRVLVDVERSRTVQGWIPRRLGGGRGPARGSHNKSKSSAPPSHVSSDKSYSSQHSSHHYGNGGSSSNFHTHRDPSPQDRYSRMDKNAKWMGREEPPRTHEYSESRYRGRHTHMFDSSRNRHRDSLKRDRSSSHHRSDRDRRRDY